MKYVGVNERYERKDMIERYEKAIVFRVKPLAENLASSSIKHNAIIRTHYYFSG